MAVRGFANVSIGGGLHCKLFIDQPTGKTFALVTTGFATGSSADKNSLVAFDVTDRDKPREVAVLRTPVACTEGVLVLGEFAYLGGFCPPAVGGLLVSVDLRALGTNGTLQTHNTLGPDLALNNLVGAVTNSSYRSRSSTTAARTEALPPIFFGSVSAHTFLICVC